MRFSPKLVPSVLLAAALAACNPLEQAKAPPPAPPAPPPPAVTVAKPETRNIVDRDEYIGRFSAIEMVDVRARVSGYLDAINFRDGQVVEKGDLLFVIDKRPYQAALDQAKADLDRTRARVESADSDLQRSERLVKDKNISEQVYDQRVAAKKDADAQLESADAALRRAQLELDFTELHSPVRGRIGDRRVAVGNLVTGGAGGNTTLLGTIVSTDPIYFEFNVDEASYLRFSRRQQKAGADGLGLQIDLKLLDEDGFAHKGRLDFVDNVVDQSSGTIRMRAAFENGNDLFRPGMFGRVRLATSDPYDAVLVPESAVLSDQSKKLVLTLGPENVVVPRPVVLGPAIDGMRVVKSGLTADDQLIVNGLMKARPGAKVTPQPPAPPAAAQGGPAASTAPAPRS
jgi:RND family efflux transporter MFP subunit